MNQLFRSCGFYEMKSQPDSIYYMNASTSIRVNETEKKYMHNLFKMKL